MHILGIETSCDETAAAVVADGETVLSSVISSQVDEHAAYGGVIPELAAREHTRAIDRIVGAALREAETSVERIEAVAAVNRPGLVPALLVGVNYAKGLAASLGVPFVPLDHILAHLYAAFLGERSALASPSAYPMVALVVSGGHTLLLQVAADGSLAVLGQTLDDAAGEAFDKAAKVLRLGYPGGPVIDRLARKGDSGAVAFPRGLSGGRGRPPKPENRFNFSFSGVKTALLYHVGDRCLEGKELHDVAASYQKSVVDVLVQKTVEACRHVGASTVVVCGGVACNSLLRKEMDEALSPLSAELRIAPPCYCSDNAAMTAGLAWHWLKHDPGTVLDAPVDGRFRPPSVPLPFAPATA